ncbi:MAG: hypothetical protein R2707_21210 [Acidimicrobiales bacterium]
MASAPMTVACPSQRIRCLRPLVVGTALLLAVSGCSDDSDTAAPAAPVSTTSVAPEPADILPAGAEDLVGRWAHFDAVAYEDDVFKSLIISTGFSDLELRDGVLWNRQRFCHAEMANDQGIDTSISDEATSAIIPIDTPVEVSSVDGRLRVVRPATPTPIGIDLADPANDALPTDPDDPRIVDSDGDGFPGVTAHIRITDDIEGDLYIARREIFEYDVTQESPDRLVGTITDSSEQLVLGASNEIFITPAQWEQVPDPSLNPVIWQRVDADWDCARLAAERDEIFPPDPVVDW